MAAVAASLDDFVEYIAFLVDGVPEPVIMAADRYDHLVSMPYVAWARRFPPQAAGMF
ncbi:UNVERIFIED_ORG: hypothetical protein GGE63_004933 [Rhizobium esperanzae]